VSTTPIAEYAMVSDCHSAALVDRRGSLDWWCTPRFDSPSLFGRILDERAGHFSIRPAGDAEVERTYVDGTLVLTTTFRTVGGVVELTDALALADGVRGHDVGLDSPQMFLRRAACTAGSVDLDVDFVPRPEYGLTSPLLRLTPGGATGRGGPIRLDLSTSAHLRCDRDDAAVRARVRLAAGESVGFAVQTTSSWGPPSIPLTQDEIERRITDTIEGWRSWEAVHQSYRGVYPDLVRTSGRVLYGLTYQPTGAIVAAPTTSLPEVVGGARNWDYRYCWVRDASFTLNALWVAACPDEADRFLHFLTTAASSISVRRELQIMFGICGERDLTEHELPHLAGWRSSAPVRVGNGAWNQRQLDVYGELLGAVHRLQAVFEEFDESTMRFLVALADAAAVVWREKDQGIWEIRDEPRHYLYSKLMCWVALDRAIDMAGKLGADDRVETWAAERAAIRSVILEEGWSEEVGAFTQSFGSTSLDASNLVIPLVGFLPADDPRVAATIEATEQHLTDDRGLVYRYRSADGLAGHEGTFLLCTFWLAEALATSGRIDRARSVFDRAAAFANDVGLLSEEVEPATGELIGNYPQAFSHIGLINAAWAINEAASRAG
jgi:GH15 family glucan-1,4-alpha-glucosidase